MASNFAPEIKSAMNEPPKSKSKPPTRETPADMARDKARGIKEGSPQDEAIDAKLPVQAGPPMGMMRPGGGMQGGPPPGANPAHAAMAASIAHAILQRGGQ